MTKVFCDSEFLIEAGILEHHADALPHVVGLLPNVVTEDRCCAAGWSECSRQDFEKGGLAPAVWSQQSEDLSSANLETDAIERAAGRRFASARVFMDDV